MTSSQKKPSFLLHSFFSAHENYQKKDEIFKNIYISRQEIIQYVNFIKQSLWEWYQYLYMCTLMKSYYMRIMNIHFSL